MTNCIEILFLKCIIVSDTLDETSIVFSMGGGVGF